MFYVVINGGQKICFFSTSELHYCTGAYRISPTDVNSRPSSCLTNFLLNGKLDSSQFVYFLC